MKILITSSYHLPYFSDLSTVICGAGEIDALLEAKALADAGHDVSVLVSKERNSMVDSGIYFTNKNDGEYDVTIGHCIPVMATVGNSRIRLAVIHHDNHWLPPRTADWYDADWLSQIDMFIVVGGELYRVWMPDFALGRVQILYPVVSDHIEPVSIEERTDLFFSGVPIKGSGVNTIIEAAGYFPKMKLHVYGSLKLWGGEDSKEWMAYLGDLAEKSGNVEFHGAIPWRKCVSEIASRKIMLHGKWHETFGRSIVESQCAGIPVVAAPYTGIPERIQDGMTGILCNRTPEEYAGNVELLLRDHELYRYISETCLRLRYGFSARMYIERFERIICRIEEGKQCV
jgi:glycosyltransferase involved in cell wall biosynthesis